MDPDEGDLTGQTPGAYTPVLPAGATVDQTIDYYNRLIQGYYTEITTQQGVVNDAWNAYQQAPTIGRDAAATAYSAASRMLDQMRDTATKLEQQRDNTLKIQQEAAKANTPEAKEAAQVALDLQKAQLEVAALQYEGYVLDNEAKRLEAAGQLSPEVAQARASQKADIDARLGEAQIRSERASAAAQQFENQINQQFGVTLAELGVAQAGADVDATVAGTALTGAQTQQVTAEITRLLALLPGDLETQKANILSILTSAGYTQAQTDQIFAELAAGLPAAQVRAQDASASANEATAVKTAEETRQLTMGDLATQIEQFSKAIQEGRMTPDMANAAATKLLYGASPFEMAQEANTQLNTLTANAMQAGMLVSPGTTTMDPGGAMAAQLGKLGIQSPDFSLQTATIPEWAQGMGVQTQYPQVQTFDQQGQMVPGAWAQGGGQGIDMSPQEYEALVAQTAAAVPPGGGAPPQSQAAAASAPPPPAAAPGAAPTFNISVNATPAPPITEVPVAAEQARLQATKTAAGIPSGNTEWRGLPRSGGRTRTTPAWAQ